MRNAIEALARRVADAPTAEAAREAEAEAEAKGQAGDKEMKWITLRGSRERYHHQAVCCAVLPRCRQAKKRALGWRWRARVARPCACAR